MIILDCFALLAMTNGADYMHGELITKYPLRGFAPSREIFSLIFFFFLFSSRETNGTTPKAQERQCS
jgi:hypothetical protein